MKKKERKLIKKNIQSFYCMVIAMKNISFGVINYYYIQIWYSRKCKNMKCKGLIYSSIKMF